MDNVAISVIVPCYNYGRYLSDAIHSLIGGKTSLGDFEPQTFQDFDVIIVDDASTEVIYDFVRPFLNERIRYLRNPENIGTAATLNVGIKEAMGQYITFLSADDMMETTRLGKLYEAAEKYRHMVIYDNLMTFANGARKDIMPLMDYDFEKLLYKNIMHAGVLYSKQAWIDCGGYPEAFKDGREDWAFNVALGEIGYCGAHVKEPLYLYRWEGQNRSNRNKGSQVRLQFQGKMQATYPDLYRGERPNMCCGSKSKSEARARMSSVSKRTVPNSPNRYAPLAYGDGGTTLIEYLLNKAGPVQYFGAVTKKQYQFGGQQTQNYVDNLDVPALLSRIEDRRHAFQLAEIQPVAQIVIEPARVQVKEMITEPVSNVVILDEPTEQVSKKRGRPKRE